MKIADDVTYTIPATIDDLIILDEIVEILHGTGYPGAEIDRCHNRYKK